MTVQLFATCLGDLVFPTAVADAEALLREAGHEAVFPRQQICCGQPAYNAGHRSAARRVAKIFTLAFAPVVFEPPHAAMTKPRRPAAATSATLFPKRRGGLMMLDPNPGRSEKASAPRRIAHRPGR